jgi:putative peptidoglycan lipid II flippase
VSGAGAVAGLALDALILFWFGAGTQTDAYFAALVIPTLLIGILSIQLPKILVPIFGTLFRLEEDEGWRLLRNLLTTCGLLFAGVAIVGSALAGFIMPLQVPGMEPGAIALTARLSRVLVWLVWFQGLSSVLQAVLYARHSYAVSSAAKLVINSVTIGVVLGAGRSGLGIETVAWGVVMGSFAQLVLLLTVLAAHGFRYRWTCELASPQLRGILSSFSYPLLSHVLGESGSLVQSVLASFLGSGSLTLLNYASRILGAIGGILLGSVVQVTLPTVAAHAAANDVTLQRRTLLEAIQILGLVAVPLSIWLAFTAEPLVKVLFQRGQFSAADAVATAVIIRTMVVYFLLARFVSVTQTLFYANSDFRTPFISTVIFTISNTACALMLVRWLGAPGIGVAVSIASLCNAAYMILKLQSRFGPVGWADMWPFGLRLGICSALAGVGFVAGLGVSSTTAVSEPVARLLAVAIPSLFGFTIFVVAGFVCGVFDTRPMAPIANTMSA